MFNMKTYLILLLCCVGFNLSLVAQQPAVQIINDEHLDSLIVKNIESNKTHSTIQGYRVQIFFGTDRKVANEERTKFLNLFPEVEAYLIYQQPYFKVRVGDYRTALDAQAMYRKILNEFDKIFIVPDKINLPKLD